MRRSLDRAFANCTSNRLSVLPTDLEVIDRQCRHAADVYIGRDAGKLALHSGMRAQQISRQREIVEDTIPALAEVGAAIGGLVESCLDGKRSDAERSECRAELRRALVHILTLIDFNEVTAENNGR